MLGVVPLIESPRIMKDGEERHNVAIGPRCIGQP